MSISRRSMVKGAVWAAPTVIATATIPAYAASAPLAANVTKTINTEAVNMGVDFNVKHGTGICTSMNAWGFCSYGQAINSITPTTSHSVVLGYGDWSVNTDSYGRRRVEVLEYNLDSLTRTNPTFYLGSEAVDYSYVSPYDGTVYLPTVDPSNKPATGQSRPTDGFAHNKFGEWQFYPLNTGAIHVFQMAELGSGELIIGASDAQGDAVLLRGTLDSGFKRVYWAKGDNGGWGRIHYVRADLFSERLFFHLHGASLASNDTPVGWYEYDVRTHEVRLVTKASGDLRWIDGYPVLFGANGDITNLDTKKVIKAPFDYESALTFSYKDKFYALDRQGVLWDYFPSGWLRLRSTVTFASGLTPTSFALIGQKVIVGYNNGAISSHTF